MRKNIKKLIAATSFFAVFSGVAGAATMQNNLCVTVTKFTPAVSQWWVSGTFNLTNTCNTVQSASGLQLVLSANQALSAANFSINNVSFNPWSSVSATAAAVSGNADAILISLTTGGTIPANGSAAASFGYNPGGVVLTGLSLVSNGTAPVVIPVAGTPPPAESISTGTIYFHAYVPQTSTSAFSQGDSMVLDGDNYTDLIMSNYISGVLLGHTILAQFPGVQFNKDYLYGTEFGQLLQENIKTEDYQSSSLLIDPNAEQASVMGAGQGGAYQINNYLADMVGASSGGYAMANYIAIQKNIGFTLGTTSLSATPLSFNNKYYGPVLPTYFHLNDLRALLALENGSQGTVSAAAPNFPQCMKNLVNTPNSPLEILVNYAYNQGYQGGLLGTATSDCVNMTESAFVAKYNNYATASGDSYSQYPYQVRFYLDELYNRSSLSPQTNNHVAFKMPLLETVFSNVFQTIAYVNSSESYVYITNTQANTAFNTAMTKVGVSSSTILDLSDASQRATIFSLLETAISTLESNLGADFSKTTLTDLTSTGSGGSSGGTVTPKCPVNPAIYPNGLGSYVGGTIVKASDGNLYQCISNQVDPWCNSTAAWAYAPASGSAWSSAWTLYNCTN